MKPYTILIFVFLSAPCFGQQQVYSFKSNPAGFFVFQELLFFVGETEESGKQLWYTNGEGTTKMLKNINAARNDHFGVNMTPAVLNGNAFFIVSNESEYDIWKTDATEQGTSKVVSFSKPIYSLTQVGNSIFFLIKEGNQLQVWKTDGTNAGTVLVKGEMSIWNQPSFEGTLNNLFVFTFQPYGTNDSRVWRSDGTDAGTFPLTDMIDGNGAGPGGTSALTQYTNFNNKLYFVSRYYLHETDGTIENTKIVSPLWQAATTLVTYADAVVANNKIYFQFIASDKYRQEIWESDGTQQGTQQIYAVTRNNHTYPSNLIATDTALFFCSSTTEENATITALNYHTHATTSFEHGFGDLQHAIIFDRYSNVASIKHIAGNEYFVNINPGARSVATGWIINLSNKMVKNDPALDTIFLPTEIFKSQLYYSKQSTLWKYSDENAIDTLPVITPTSALLYPNPASNYIYLNAGDDLIEKVVVYDMNGRQQKAAPDASNRLDISTLQRGNYFVKYIIGDRVVVKRFVKL